MALPVIMVMNHQEEQTIKVDFPVNMLLDLVEDSLEEDLLMILGIPLVKHAVLHQLGLVSGSLPKVKIIHNLRTQEFLAFGNQEDKV